MSLRLVAEITDEEVRRSGSLRNALAWRGLNSETPGRWHTIERDSAKCVYSIYETGPSAAEVLREKLMANNLMNPPQYGYGVQYLNFQNAPPATTNLGMSFGMTTGSNTVPIAMPTWQWEEVKTRIEAGTGVKQPARPPAKESNMQWLDRRINEMRVRL